jgi:hypothetical protein
MILSRRFIRPLLGVGLALGALGCGSAANDDAGVSFLNLGFFDVDADTNTCTEDGITGASLRLGQVSEEGGTSDGRACIGLQNNLAGQFIRSDRATISYFVPGAASQPPNAVVPLTTVLGPGSVGAPSTLPDGVDNESSAIAGLNLVPTDIRNYMIINRSDFPPAPFSMLVSVTVSGMSSGGDRIDTNPADIGVEILQ